MRRVKRRGILARLSQLHAGLVTVRKRDARGLKSMLDSLDSPIAELFAPLQPGYCIWRNLRRGGQFADAHSDRCSGHFALNRVHS
jgi:hypothetical protein